MMMNRDFKNTFYFSPDLHALNKTDFTANQVGNDTIVKNYIY